MLSIFFFFWSSFFHRKKTIFRSPFTASYSLQETYSHVDGTWNQKDRVSLVQDTEGGSSTWRHYPYLRFQIGPWISVNGGTIYPFVQAKSLRLILDFSLAPVPLTHPKSNEPASATSMSWICQFFSHSTATTLVQTTIIYFSPRILQYFSWLIHSCSPIIYPPIKQSEWSFKNQIRSFILLPKNSPGPHHWT